MAEWCRTGACPVSPHSTGCSSMVHPCPPDTGNDLVSVPPRARFEPVPAGQPVGELPQTWGPFSPTTVIRVVAPSLQRTATWATVAPPTWASVDPHDLPGAAAEVVSGDLVGPQPGVLLLAEQLVGGVVSPCASAFRKTRTESRACCSWRPFSSGVTTTRRTASRPCRRTARAAARCAGAASRCAAAPGPRRRGTGLRHPPLTSSSAPAGGRGSSRSASQPSGRATGRGVLVRPRGAPRTAAG